MNNTQLFLGLIFGLTMLFVTITVAAQLAGNDGRPLSGNATSGWDTICDSPAAPIGCNSPLPIIVIVVILAWAIWIYTHENNEEAKA